MIPLRISIKADEARQPFVVRLNISKSTTSTSHDVFLTNEETNVTNYDGPGGQLEINGLAASNSDGDVLLVVPSRRIAHRLIRSKSPHNTLLITERCDQLCVMCSQPPKAKHVDLFEHLKTAVLLSPPSCIIGLSGGEPTLYKDQLFELLHSTLNARPDVSFHVLTNAQHFSEQDISAIRALPHGKVVWGVPLYSCTGEIHDQIVGKPGALESLLSGLSILCLAGAGIELRTVIMRPNVGELPQLARFVTSHLPFVIRWALMQLENIGYARKNWESLFVDTSISFDEIGAAIDIAKAQGISALMYNFPLCTVPSAYRDLAPSTISDWKQRFLTECNDCSARNVCGGFFEWYPEDKGFREVHQL